MGSYPNVFDVAASQLEKLTKEADIPMDQNGVKQSGVPMGGGAMPPMDPSMMGGGAGMPMDPSMMGGAMPPMDPSMMGGAAAMPPAAPPAAPGGQAVTVSLDDLRQLLQEAQGGAGGTTEKGPDGDTSKVTAADIMDRLESLEMMVGSLAQALVGGEAGLPEEGMPMEGEVLLPGGLPPEGAAPTAGMNMGTPLDLGSLPGAPGPGMEVEASAEEADEDNPSYALGQLLAQAKKDLQGT